MSLFEDGSYRWRETYFVLFDQARRPTMRQFESMVDSLPGRYELSDARQNEEGLIESVTILSPEDFAALDVSYIGGEEVIEQTANLLGELKPIDGEEKEKLAKLSEASGRLDVMHFEHVSGEPVSDDPDEMFDPSALLVMLDHLIELTNGVAFDPQAGALL